MLTHYSAFNSRGCDKDLADCVIFCAAFGKIVTTLVEGVIMPPIGLLMGQVDFSSLFVVLGDQNTVPTSWVDAKEKGIPVIAYGQLITDATNFLIVAAAVFLMVKQVNRIKSSVDKPAAAPAASTKECTFCASTISIKARRCPNCTSQR
jgi:large conductance mechanosensitive channel